MPVSRSWKWGICVCIIPIIKGVTFIHLDFSSCFDAGFKKDKHENKSLLQEQLVQSVREHSVGRVTCRRNFIELEPVNLLNGEKNPRDVIGKRRGAE